MMFVHWLSLITNLWIIFKISNGETFELNESVYSINFFNLLNVFHCQEDLEDIMFYTENRKHQNHRYSEC